jgi:hypothetical protein
MKMLKGISKWNDAEKQSLLWILLDPKECNQIELDG